MNNTEVGTFIKEQLKLNNIKFIQIWDPFYLVKNQYTNVNFQGLYIYLSVVINSLLLSAKT